MVIGYARKKIITEEDLETQILGITLQQNEIERQMEDAKLLMGNRTKRLEDLANVFREKVRTGFEELSNNQSSPTIEKARKELKRNIINSIVERIDVFSDKTVKVHFFIDFQKLINDDKFVDISYLPTKPLVTDVHNYQISLTL